MNLPFPDEETEQLADLRSALEALRASEELKARLIECSRDCIKMLDLDGRLLSMNAGGMEALEICDLGPLLNNSWIEFWQGEDRTRAASAVAAARAGSVGRFVGYFPTAQTKTPKWFDVVVSPILDAQGTPERLLALSRDVTDLKRAEQILRDSNEELERRVGERTADLERANAALRQEAAERRRGEATLRSIVEGVEAETGERFFSSLVQYLAAALAVQYAFVSELSADRLRFRTLAVWGRGTQRENLEIPLAGSPCESVLQGQMSHHAECLQQLYPDDIGLVDWGVESYAGVPMIDSSGIVVGHLAIFDDKPMPDGARALSIMRIFAARAVAEITRRNAEAELSESEERLDRILHSAMDAIVTFDAQRRVELFNVTAAKVFSCPAVEVISQPLDRFLTPELLAALERAMRNASPHAYLWAPQELRAARANGQLFPVEATLSHVEVRGRSLYTLILRDLDERLRAEAELSQLHRQNQYLQEEIKSSYNFDEIVGRGPSLERVLRSIGRVAETDSTVLLTGETGTGKELVARAVHSNSSRRDRPLVKVNCAALPAGLIESELFGHEKGAFTGATERRLGRFELAHQGTIFLDEIGEMPLDVQVKLLRVLQEEEFERVGGQVTIEVDVRLIAATNRDLEKEVREGRFREDLYYRLNVFPIRIPPLRERTGDIPLLAHYFVRRYAKKIGRTINGITPQAIARLTAYHWPGNVRELENVIERAVILSSSPELEIAPEVLSIGAAPPPATANPAAGAGALEQVERDHIVQVLESTSWRIDGLRGAARILDLNPSTLRSRMKKLGIHRA